MKLRKRTRVRAKDDNMHSDKGSYTIASQKVGEMIVITTAPKRTTEKPVTEAANFQTLFKPKGRRALITHGANRWPSRS